jgi:tetratricopeptide (TPR) repeat protein
MISRMIRKHSFLFAAALAISACASANKRFDQGHELEVQGRPAEAVERYIQALKKDSRQDSARAGLRRAGAAAQAQYMATATNPATQAPAAADAYLSFDDLQRRALEVGVFLPEPTGYAEGKRRAFDRAIDRAVSDAPLLVSSGQYDEALRRLQRASTAYQPSSQQVSAIGGAGAGAMLAWARTDTAQGNFRAGYERVDRMGEVTGASATHVNEARALQAAALARGTRRVAVAPPWGTIAARNELPEDALATLGDALLQEPWLTPPLWVAVVPPDQVEREVRRMGLARRTITTADAGRLARIVNADFIVVTEIDSVQRTDANVRVTRRPVRTRLGVDTAYVIEEGNARLHARATFAVIDRDGQRVAEYRTTSATATSPFTRVRFAGDYRILDLRQSERELFERSRGEGDLVRAFAAAMSPRLASDVFAEVTRRIP